ncbi:MAG TPA: hypothetical protein PLE19_05415 [Planctomycetota bacterium]|nr:hypothetical protein [Planctomycetota bacterium]HRR80905.1 hypothetical protein [Planctomycetota bacterium]HRT93522.1 hypothetical protein [Planctomycetota bacterium]
MPGGRGMKDAGRRPLRLEPLEGRVLLNGAPVIVPFDAATPVTWLDANLTAVTASLKGPGAGQVWLPAGGQGDATRIELTGTTAKSSLTITPAAKGATTTVLDVAVAGSLGKLTAPAVTLGGNLTLTGSVGKLTLGNVADQHLISLGLDPLVRSVSLAFGRVSDATLTSLMGIKSLQAIEWLDTDAVADTITAPWIGSLAATGLKGDPTHPGHFEAGLELDGSGNPKQTLGKAAIAGTLADATWHVTGSVGKASVGRWGGGAVLAVGVDPGPDGQFFTADDAVTGGILKGLTAGALDTVHTSLFGVTAAQVGKVTLAGLKLTPADLPFAQGDFRVLWAPDALHKGVALPLWNENVDLGQLNTSLANLKALGVNWVELNVFWFQDTIASTVIAPDFTRWSASDASVRAAIDAVHAQGMRVMLKPLVDLRNDPTHWRGNIPGSAEWFTGVQGYGAFLNHWAAIAEEKGVELLCVGTELVTASAQEAAWRAVVAGVRARYSGPLVYAANQGGTASATQENIAWWDALDYIGLDAYYPLTTKTNPTVAELQAAWAARAAMIDAWLASLDPADRKPVLFTEVGYRSWDGANMDPASQAGKGNANVDLQEQADCYTALFSTLWRQESWLMGVYWWNWEVDPNPVWEAANWYTPQGKPAQAVIGQYYA